MEKTKDTNAFKRYKQPRNSVLGNCLKKRIELVFPVYLRGIATTWPVAGSFAATYTFDGSGVNPAQCFQRITGSLGSGGPYFVPGSSREFDDLIPLYSMCRMESFTVDFVRTYVDSATLLNVPPLSLAVVPTANSNYNAAAATIIDLSQNWSYDSNSYIQPVNNDKFLKGTVYANPERSIQTVLTTTMNQWVPIAQIINSNYQIQLGQKVWGVSISNGSLREIGNVICFIDFEFCVPQAQ